MTLLKPAAMSVLLAAAGLCLAAPQGLRDYRALAIDAAGERIAAVETVVSGAMSRRPHASVVVRDTSGKVLAAYDPCAACTYDFPSFSPVQQALSFIGTDARAGSATLYLVSDGKVTALTTIKGIANTARWSPDGSQLAMLATIGAKKMTGAVEAGARQVGEIGTEEDEQRIAIVPRKGGEATLVSPADTFVYEYDWTPDGKGFVVTSAKGNGDNNWWIATLGHVDAASGVLRVLAAPQMQIRMPRVSKDGRQVAFIGGLMSDFGPVGGDLYAVPISGGEAVDITPGFRGSFNGLSWQDGKILASALVGANQSVQSLTPTGGVPAMLWSAPVSASASRDGAFAFGAAGAIAASVQEDYEHAPHIVAGRLPRLQQITHDNDHFLPQVAARSISWSSDQFTVQGWLAGPQHVEAGKRYPLVVIMHGGPSSAVTPRFVAEGEEAAPLVRSLTRAGYFVLAPNPRGSFGQGADFASANKRDFGGGDWRDILAGIDAAAEVAPIDTARLGLMGHSYGGFMTMWGVTHSQRFKAAVAGAGIADWISYYGQNGIDQWMIPFFSASVYDAPAVYRAASPIESIKAARTPTLLYVGERDVECPPAQSVEFWHGLKAMHTPTALIVYEGEGHALRKLEHQRDQRARTVAWFDRYLK